jgi:hypothetical protein
MIGKFTGKLLCRMKRWIVEGLKNFFPNTKQTTQRTKKTYHKQHRYKAHTCTSHIISVTICCVTHTLPLCTKESHQSLVRRIHSTHTTTTTTLIMSVPKRNKSSIMRSDEEVDPVRVEMQGFYWPRLLVKQTPNEKKRPTIKIPRRLNKADKKSKALLLRQLIKNIKVSSPSVATVPLPPMLPSLDRSRRSVEESFSSYATASTIRPALSWNPPSSTRASRITGNLWPHRVPVVLDEQSYGNVSTTTTTTFSSLPSSPTSIMGRNHHPTPSRPRTVTLDAH